MNDSCQWTYTDAFHQFKFLPFSMIKPRDYNVVVFKFVSIDGQWMGCMMETGCIDPWLALPTIQFSSLTFSWPLNMKLITKLIATNHECS